MAWPDNLKNPCYGLIYLFVNEVESIIGIAQQVMVLSLPAQLF